MLGDDANVPAKAWNSYCLSDNIYADVDGDDLPDINVARITARNTGELHTMINKFIDYETSPPRNVKFYDRPLTPGIGATTVCVVVTKTNCDRYEETVYVTKGYLTVTPDPLVPGNNAVFKLVKGMPFFETVYLIYSLNGMGAVWVPQLNVHVNILSPKLISSQQINSHGIAEWDIKIPMTAPSIDIWFQGAWDGGASNVVETSIL